jgi:signal transduction histidine kinase
MIQLPSNSRYLLPLVASGLLSFALCAALAVSLFREQSSSAEVLQENIASHRAAADLQENLADLAALLRARVEGVAALNDRISRHIETARGFANHPEERLLVSRADDSFQHYLSLWRALPDLHGPQHEANLEAALHVIESDVLRQCQELRDYNAGRIDQANQEHRATLRQLAWGLAAIGFIAGLTGLLLGYGVARGLSRSIQRLQVRVQDAAGKLGQDIPPVEFTLGGNLAHLDQQVQQLVGRIEEVVERLRQRDREVRRAEQLAAIGQLAAGMAHEIRNPLTSIKMLIQAAGEDDRGGLRAEDLSVIEREIRRVERLLRTFLEYARPSRPAKAPINPANIISETLELTRGRANKQHVQVRFDPPFKSITVDADPSQLRQVLINLVLNALDAMPGGGSLSIELSATGPWLEVHVADTGAGIADEIRPRLFEPFASTKDTGLGLGLVICRRIVEDHGGTIVASSPPGGGARFTIRLPRLGAPG